MSCALIACQYRASVYGIPAPLIVAPLTSGEKRMKRRNCAIYLSIYLNSRKTHFCNEVRCYQQ